MKRGGDAKRGSPHSERAGEAVLPTGERATVYRALRELTCSPCGNIIREGELFTREAELASGLPLVRLCRGCAPFSTGGGLLDALLVQASPHFFRQPHTSPRTLCGCARNWCCIPRTLPILLPVTGRLAPLLAVSRAN
jgi:hypothetical protein